jgi:hypothetical protein
MPTGSGAVSRSFPINHIADRNVASLGPTRCRPDDIAMA